MSSLDRFFIGGLVSVSAVTFYATPYELVTKAFIIPGAIVGVLFPSFSAVTVSPGSMRALYARGIRLVLLAMCPLIAIMMLGGRLGLQVWVGEELANQS